MKSEAFSSRLKRLREGRGIKVKDMASELGISVSMGIRMNTSMRNAVTANAGFSWSSEWQSWIRSFSEPTKTSYAVT